MARFGIVSDSSQVEEMLAGLEAVTMALPEGEAKQVGDITQRTLEETFRDVSEEWGRLVMTKLDNYATTMRGFGFMHWTRHLYEGGHVDNMGISSKRLIHYVPGDKQIRLEFEALEDSAPSYSPVSNSTTGYWGNKYPAWEERAKFMFANALEGYADRKIIRGSRKSSDQPFIGATQPKYIINKRKNAGPNQPQYIFANEFVFNYAPQKFERDAWLKEHYTFSTDYVMSQLDRTFRMTLDKHMDKLAATANRNTPAPIINQNRVLSPAQTASRFAYSKRTARTLANRFVERFGENYKLIQRGRFG